MALVAPDADELAIRRRGPGNIRKTRFFAADLWRQRSEYRLSGLAAVDRSYDEKIFKKDKTADCRGLFARHRFPVPAGQGYFKKRWPDRGADTGGRLRRPGYNPLYPAGGRRFIYCLRPPRPLS